MATTLQQATVAVDLRGIVDNAKKNVDAVRRMRAIELETTFQQMISDGLPYVDQIRFLKDRISEEQNSSFKSTEMIAELETRVANTKKLQRFNNYRTTYQQILTELKSGRTNSKDQLVKMKSMLASVGDDQELQLEIERDITTMEGEVKAMEDTMIQNQIRRAQYDGTEKVLNETINMVKGKRADAVMKGLDDESSAYDTWLTVLNKQLSETTISNKINDIDVRVNTKGMNAVAKLDELNETIRGADSKTPIKIGNAEYKSAAEYWTFTRDSYLAGAGSGLFRDFFSEIDSEYSEKLNATLRRDGMVTPMTLDRIQTEFKSIKSRDGMQNFAERATDFESLILGGAIQSTAESIRARASITGDYLGADTFLQGVAAKYGINVDSYRMPLAAEKEQRIAEIARATGETPEAVSRRLGMEDILTPEDKNFMIPSAPDTSSETPNVPGASQPGRFAAAAGYQGASVVDFLRQAGQPSDFASREKLAGELGIENYTGSVQQNNLLLNKMRADAISPVTPIPPTPMPTPEEKASASEALKKFSIENSTVKPVVNTPTAPTKTQPSEALKNLSIDMVKNPQPVAAPTPAPTTSYNTSYTGGSIVDFLSQSGQAADFQTRTKLAADAGITNYVGSADQNTQLLKKLRGF